MESILCPECEGPRFEVGMASVGVFRKRVICLLCSHCGGKLPFNAQGTYDATDEMYKTTGPDVLKKAVQSNKQKLQGTYAVLKMQRDKCCAGSCDDPYDKTAAMALTNLLEQLAALETEMKINKQDQKQIEEEYGIEL